MSDKEPAGSSAFHLEQGARIGKVEVGGHVAGRDVTVGVTPTEAASAKDRDEILALLRRLQEDVAALQEAPSGLRNDAEDELRKAQAAGESGDDDRFAEKLETARGYLERIGASLPAALSLAQTVAVLAQRSMGMA